ncbi:MAG: DUF5050 domain-containing protein [Defluviitaleaceae bacterium]|nr:DUF5050 domain-containing protein [Defluviitaleaceae bacterium]
MPYIYIDAELNAKSINGRQIAQLWHLPGVPQNAGEAYVMDLPLAWRSFATVGDWVYFIQRETWSDMHLQLYRIRTDGTEKALLQEESNVGGLFASNNLLFATVLAEPEFQFDGEYMHAVLLSDSMETVVHFGSGWSGQHSRFIIQSITGTDLVAAMEGTHFPLFNQITGVYCTRTGAVFTPGI